MTNQNQQPRPTAYPTPAPQAAATPMPAGQPIPRPAPSPLAAPTPSQAAPHPVVQQPQAMPNPLAVPNYAPAQAMPHPHSQAQTHVSGQPMPAQAPMPNPALQQPTSQPLPAHLAAAPAAAAPMVRPQEEEQREGGEKALPSISIHAFCDRPETAGAIDNSKRDWRMKRTNVKIYLGGLPAAIDFYHKENTPGVVMIETGMRGPELFSQLEQLASVCDAGTKVVIIGAANDIRLYRQLMDQGVSDYLVPPLSPLNIIHSLGDIYSDPEKPFVGRVAAFFGAKGGVGSSTLAHNIAWCLSERVGKETALVDLDASWGTTGLDFAYDNAQGLEEALAEPDRLDGTLLDRIMIRHTSKLSILPAGGSLGASPVMSADAYEAVVDAVRGVSPLSILDIPHYWSEWTSRVLVGCDDIVITATPDLTSLRNTKNLIDYLRAKRPNDADPILILNCMGMTKTNEITLKDFGAAVGLDPAVALSFDPDAFYEALNDGKMLTEVKAAASHVAGCEYIASRLGMGRYPDMNPGKAAGKFGFLSGGKGSKKSKDEKSSGSLLAKLTKRK